MAQAVCDLLPGANYAIGPADRGRLLLRLRAARVAVARGPASGSRRGCARSWRKAQPFVREELSRDEALERFADQPYKREIVEAAEADEGAARRPVLASTRTTAGPTCASARTCPSTDRLGAFKLLSVAGAYWRGDETAPAAPARLRHRVGDAGGPGRLPASAGGGRTPRPPQARPAARPVLLPRGAGRRACWSGTRAAACSASSWRTSCATSTWSAATTWSSRRTSRARSCGRPRATWRSTPTTCTRRCTTSRRTTTSSR